MKAGYAAKNGDGSWSIATPTPEQLNAYAASVGLTGRHQAAHLRYADQRKQWVTTGLDDLRKRRPARSRAMHLVADEVTGEILRTFPTRDAALEAAGRRFPPPSPEPPDWDVEDTTDDQGAAAA